MHKNRYDKAWIEWIQERVLSRNMKPLLITVTAPKKLHLEKPCVDYDTAFTRYEHFYKGFCNVLIGSNWARSPKHRLQPLSLTWIDYPGTKNYSPNLLEQPHTHSIVLVEPELREKIAGLKSKGYVRLREKLNWASSNIMCIGETTTDIANTFLYCSKYMKYDSYITQNYNSDLTVIHPISQSEKIKRQIDRDDGEINQY